MLERPEAGPAAFPRRASGRAFARYRIGDSSVTGAISRLTIAQVRASEYALVTVWRRLIGLREQDTALRRYQRRAPGLTIRPNASLTLRLSFSFFLSFSLRPSTLRMIKTPFCFLFPFLHLRARAISAVTRTRLLQGAPSLRVAPDPPLRLR